MSEPDNHDQTLTRRVNEEIRSGSPPDSAEPIPFFCECNGACFHAVWLSASDYDTLIQTPDAPLLAPGHEHQRSERARTIGDRALAVA